MATIFSSAPGRSTVYTGEAVPMAINVGGVGAVASLGGFNNLAIIGAAVGASDRFQFQQSLDAVLYLYVFGGGVGTFSVTGLTFGNCADPGLSGADLSYFYFNNYRLARVGQPVRCQFGSYPTVFNGYLVGYDWQIVDPSSGLGQFALKFHHVPIPGSTALPNVVLPAGNSTYFAYLGSSSTTSSGVSLRTLPGLENRAGDRVLPAA